MIVAVPSPDAPTEVEDCSSAERRYNKHVHHGLRDQRVNVQLVDPSRTLASKMSESLTELDALLSSLTGAITTFQQSLHAQNLPPLRSDNAVPHPIDVGLPDPVTWYSRKAVVGLCHQIIALVQSPHERAAVDGMSYLVSAAMTVVCDGRPSAVDIVDASGEAGVDISEIAVKTGKDNIKLRTMFRLLTTAGYFKESTFGHVARTRSTFALLSGDTFIPHLSHVVSGAMASTSDLPESTKSAPVMGTPSAFESFHKMHFYSWLATHPNYVPEFQRGMTMIEQHLDAGILSDYSWENLGPAITLVDVGGGNGALSMQLLRRFKGWKAIIQDRAEVVPGTKKFWTEEAPEIVQEGRVDFLAHDFLQPTPLRPEPNNPPYVFMIKSVLINWTDDACAKIIDNLSPASTAGTPLLIVNFTPPAPTEASPSISVADYLQAVQGKTMKDIQGLSLATPAEVGAGWGYANACSSVIDGKMLTLFNGRNRTTNDFEEILEKTSWLLKGCTTTRGLSSIIRAEKSL